MMSPEYTPMDARRAAIEDLYRAITALECGEMHRSESYALAAVGLQSVNRHRSGACRCFSGQS